MECIGRSYFNENALCCIFAYKIIAIRGFISRGHLTIRQQFHIVTKIISILEENAPTRQLQVYESILSFVSIMLTCSYFVLCPHIFINSFSLADALSESR